MRVVFVLRSAEVFRVFLRFVLPMFVQYSRGFEPSSKSRLFSFLLSYLKICRRLVKTHISTVAILAQGTLSGRSVSLPFWSRVRVPLAPFFFFYDFLLSYLKICRRLVKASNSTVAILAQGTLSGRSVSLPFWSRVRIPLAPFFFFTDQSFAFY